MSLEPDNLGSYILLYYVKLMDTDNDQLTLSGFPSFLNIDIYTKDTLYSNRFRVKRLTKNLNLYNMK